MDKVLPFNLVGGPVKLNLMYQNKMGFTCHIEGFRNYAKYMKWEKVSVQFKVVEIEKLFKNITLNFKRMTH
jgi:hypothetical protein